MNGEKKILLVDKPKGMTSFAVVREIRKRLGVRKVGHAGTLDPLASGLLIIGVGEGTKLLTSYLKLPKTYEAEILLGESRTTGDMEGEVVARQAVGNVQNPDLAHALSSMTGVLELPVSPYSALKRGGEPLYKKARRGEFVEPPVRQMEVQRTALGEVEREGDAMVIKATFDVGSGTYVRSLAEELGRRLGLPATLRELRRTRIGNFRVQDALELPELKDIHISTDIKESPC